MKRVASLWLPEWAIDRLRRSGHVPRARPEPEPGRGTQGSSDATSRGRPADALPAGSLGRIAAAERARTCSVPNTPDGRPGALWAQEQAHATARSRAHRGANAGWRPGAKWARAELENEIEQLPLHQRPPMREMGRRSEPADHPFKAMPPDEPGAATARALWRGASDTIFAEPPLVTAHRVEGRDVVAAANAAARACGIAPGDWLTQARVLIAGLHILPADPEGDRAELERLALALARRWAPGIALSGEDGLFIDLTGVSHLYDGEAAFCRRLGRLLDRLGYQHRLAVADTPGAAWAFARHPDGLSTVICLPGRHEEALEPLPTTLLRLETRHIQLLDKLGVDTVGELMRLPRAPLARRFGGALVRRLDQATGRAPEPLDPVVPAEHIAVRQHFAEPIGSAEAIEHWLGRLMPRLCDALARTGRGARLVLLTAERLDRHDQRLRIGVARATRDPAHLLRLFRRRIEEIDPGFGIEALALHVLRTEPLAAEALGPALADEVMPDLAPLVDAIANRLGGRAPWRAAPVESDVPERAVATIPALDPPGREEPKLREDDVRRLAEEEDDHPWHPRWPRPVRLLARPEPVEHVLAEMPDHPPKRFTWRGESYRVIHADGPERITGEWWRRAAERDAVRDYFQLEDEEGRRFWLFRRGDGVRAETGDLSWHLHGLFG